MDELSVSIVVPVYNSARTLEPLVDRLEDVLDDREYEILLVNDGSTDESWRRIVELARERRRLRGLDLARNYGQHNALLAGIRTARNDVIVTLDADLQNPPEEIPRLLAKLDEGWDVVYGTPLERRHGLRRNLAARLTRYAFRVAMGIDMARKVSAFRAFRAPLRDSFAFFQGPYVGIDVLLSWATTRFESIQVAHDERSEGRSSYTVGQLATHAMTMLIGFSTRPIRIATALGLATVVFGTVLLAVVLAAYAIHPGAVHGFTFLASALAIFSGVQLLTLGVIGEYLARMHTRLMDRPAYALREEVGSSVTADEHAAG